MRALEFTDKAAELRSIMELNQDRVVPLEVWCSIMEQHCLAGSMLLNEATNQANVTAVQSMEKAFGSTIVIGNKYIPVAMFSHGDAMMVFDVNGNSPAKDAARFITAEEADESGFVRFGKNQWPNKRISAYGYSTVIAVRDSATYRKLQTWLSLHFDISLPPLENLTEDTIKLSSDQRAKDWISKVYDLYPGTWQNNHVMTWGEGEAQQFCMFELVPSFSKKDAVEVKWFQAYPMRGGVGSRGMQELQRLARADGISLTLFPWDKGQVSQAALTRFYKKQGYKPIARGGRSMAWSPEITEMINPDILSLDPQFKHLQQIGDFVLTAKSTSSDVGENSQLTIYCYSKGDRVGEARFALHPTGVKSGWLESEITWVARDHRGKGIASTMYAYAKMLGNDIKPSSDQLPAGREMWNAWRRSGEAKHLVAEVKTQQEKEMTQCSAQDLQRALGRGKMNAMIRHPWFQEYRNYEHAFRHGVSRAGFHKVDMFPFFREAHTTPEGRIRPQIMLQFTFSYGGTKVVQVEKYYRDKEPDDNEKRLGPSAGWKHLKSWSEDENAVEKAWKKHI
jgi:GNAT superfamily N-acetyltransferase